MAAFKLVDRKRLRDIHKRVDEIVAKLSRLAEHGYPPPTQHDSHAPAAPCTLHFDAGAQKFWNGWWVDLEHQLRSDEDHPVIVAQLAKYRSLFPSLFRPELVTEKLLVGRVRPGGPLASCLLLPDRCCSSRINIPNHLLRLVRLLALWRAHVAPSLKVSLTPRITIPLAHHP